MNYIEKLKETPLQIENFLSIESANKVYTLIDNYQNLKKVNLNKVIFHIGITILEIKNLYIIY